MIQKEVDPSIIQQISRIHVDPALAGTFESMMMWLAKKMEVTDVETGHISSL